MSQNYLMVIDNGFFPGIACHINFFVFAVVSRSTQTQEKNNIKSLPLKFPSCIQKNRAIFSIIQSMQSCYRCISSTVYLLFRHTN